MSERIFGYTWDQIQSAQQGGSLSQAIDTSAPPAKSSASPDDMSMLEKHGIDGLKEKQLFGVLDRLSLAGEICRNDWM